MAIASGVPGDLDAHNIHMTPRDTAMCFSRILAILATCRARKVLAQILSTAEGDGMANDCHASLTAFSMSPVGVNNPVHAARCVQASWLRRWLP